MSNERAYNPLDKNHLAESIAREFFKLQLHPLPPEKPFTGAGIYAIYYKGDFPLYGAIAQSLQTFSAQTSQEQPKPIYVGKSDPPGSRKGLFEPENAEDGEEEAREVLTTKPKHRKLFERLRQHATSITAATANLKLEDFECRSMLVDEVWVPLGEARLVESFRPVWNVLIEGFGSKVEGGGRTTTARSVWDILHPGRKESLGTQMAPELETQIVSGLRSASTLDELRAAIKIHRDAKRAFAKERKKPKGQGAA